MCIIIITMNTIIRHFASRTTRSTSVWRPGYDKEIFHRSKHTSNKPAISEPKRSGRSTERSSTIGSILTFGVGFGTGLYVHVITRIY